MKKIEDVNQAKETDSSIEILLSNGKEMTVDFYNNTIIRYKPNVGVEQIREFNSDKIKMYKLALLYLKKQ